MCFNRGSSAWRKADPAISSTSNHFGRLRYCTYGSMILVTKYLDTPLMMRDLLSTMSMLSSTELVMSCDTPVDCIAGLTGEEKEGIGSMPFSSLTPVSLSSTPVRLDIGYEHCVKKVSGRICYCLPSFTAKRCVISRPPLFSRCPSWSHGLINSLRPAHSRMVTD